jgi:hypothetical protein
LRAPPLNGTIVGQTNVRRQEPATDLRERIRWKRALVVLALVVLPVAIVKWPWSFLPLRWQYGLIRDADSVIEVADRLSARMGRPPACDELLQAVPDPLVADRLNYELSGDGYHLMVVCGFDCSIGYDSRSRRWK